MQHVFRVEHWRPECRLGEPIGAGYAACARNIIGLTGPYLEVGHGHLSIPLKTIRL